MTVIDHEFVVSAEDLEMVVLEEEEDELEPSDDNETFDKPALELVPVGLKMRAQVVSCVHGEIPAHDCYQVVVSCGAAEWELTKFYTDLIELRDVLLDEELDAIAPFTVSLPKQRPEEGSGNDEQMLGGITAWLDGLLQSLGTTKVLELEQIDDFFEAFWNMESARRGGPPILDLLKHANLSRADTEMVLTSTPTGTFLIRMRKSGEMVLSVSHTPSPDGTPNFWHGIIEKTASSSPKYFMKGTKIQHESLESLLSHLRKFPYSLNGGRHVLLDFWGAEEIAC